MPASKGGRSGRQADRWEVAPLLGERDESRSGKGRRRGMDVWDEGGEEAMSPLPPREEIGHGTE